MTDYKLKIEVLEGIVIRTVTGESLSFTKRKAAAIICYLALCKNGTASRESVAGLLWSDRSEEQARASLRQCIKYLRSVFDKLEFKVFTANRNDLELDTSLSSLDLFEYSRMLDGGEVPAGILEDRADPERILRGYESLDHSFAAWLQIVRQQVHDEFVEKLERIMRSPASSADLTLRAAKSLTQLDPTHEEARRFVIQSYAERGNTTAALKEYNQLWELLDEQYDMEPAEETELLIADVKLGKVRQQVIERPALPQEQVAAPSVAISPAASQQVEAIEHSIGLIPTMADNAHEPSPFRHPVIGVLPFEQGGFWDGDDMIFKGLRKDLISSIVRFREWVVVEINRSTGERTAEAVDLDTGTVDYSLDGAFYKENGNDYLVITLKNEKMRQYIWSEKIRVLPETWIDERYKIVRSLLVSISVHYSVRRISDVMDHNKAPGDIHARWIRGQALIDSYRKSSITEAADIFRDIIEIAPAYSPAYSSLSQILNATHIFFPGVLRDENRAGKSLDLARKAVELDPLDSRAQLCLGWAYAMSNRFNQSILHHRMAKELNSYDLWTNMSASQGLAFAGEVEEALEFITQAETFVANLSPIQWDYIGKIKFLANDYQGCIDALEECERDLPYIVAIKAAALWHHGRKQEAGTAFQKFVSAMRVNWAVDADPSDEQIVAWFLQCFPFRDKSAYSRLEDGLKQAGQETGYLRSRAV